MKTSNYQSNEMTTGQTMTIIQKPVQRNGIGIAGFVLSITGTVLCFVPVIKWLLLVPALLLSFIGIFRKPRALAVIGFLISLLVIAVLILMKAAFITALSALASGSVLM